MAYRTSQIEISGRKGRRAGVKKFKKKGRNKKLRGEMKNDLDFIPSVNRYKGYS